MREYLLAQRKEMKALKNSKKSKKDKHKDETPEERRARKERKRERKLRKGQTKSDGMKGVESLLKSLGKPEMSRGRARDHYRDGADRDSEDSRDRERSDIRKRSQSPERESGRSGLSHRYDESRRISSNREGRGRD